MMSIGTKNFVSTSLNTFLGVFQYMLLWPKLSLTREYTQLPSSYTDFMELLYSHKARDEEPLICKAQIHEDLHDQVHVYLNNRRNSTSDDRLEKAKVCYY